MFNQKDKSPGEYSVVGLAFLIALALTFSHKPASAQTPAAVPSGSQPSGFGLGDIQQAALSVDPRTVQTRLYQQASDLRLEALRTQALPQFAVTSQATYQSAVATVPIRLPNGEGVTPPPKFQYRLQAEVNYNLYEGGRLAAQNELERARLGEQTAGVAVNSYSLIQAATDNYFNVLLAQATAQTIQLSIDDLAARRILAEKTVRGGTALPADLARLDAQLIALEQSRDEAIAQERSAREFLRKLTDIELPEDAPLAVPDLTADVLAATDIRRPELRAFAKTRDRIAVEASAAELNLRPTVQAFAQGGVGQPNPYNFFDTKLSPYGIVGVRASWTPFDYGATKQRAAAARIQSQVIDSEEASFRQNVDRTIVRSQVDVQRLAGLVDQDARAIALNEAVLETVTAQFQEGVVLADRYTDALTDVAAARLTAARHRIELQRARANLLTALGNNPAASTDQTR